MRDRETETERDRDREIAYPPATPIHRCVYVCVGIAPEKVPAVKDALEKINKRALSIDPSATPPFSVASACGARRVHACMHGRARYLTPAGGAGKYMYKRVDLDAIDFRIVDVRPLPPPPTSRAGLPAARLTRPFFFIFMGENTTQTKRTINMKTGGRRPTMNALVVVGNGHGAVGFAMGKAANMQNAVNRVRVFFRSSLCYPRRPRAPLTVNVCSAGYPPRHPPHGSCRSPR
jgi:hypothetical protein